MINADLIETIEACPDTTITLMTKRKFVVADSLDNVIEKVVDYRRKVNSTFLAEQPEGDVVATDLETGTPIISGSPAPPMGAPAKTLSLEEDEKAA